MAKLLTRLPIVLAAACCAGAGPALAQPHGGVTAVPAPAPHISAPIPHISAPAVPHVSAPAPRITAAPHFSPVPRISSTPLVATPRFSARTPSVHQFTPRGHGFTARGFARPTVHGPAATRHALGRAAGRSTRSASRSFPGRDLTRRATRTTGNVVRSTARDRALAKDKLRTGEARRLANDRNRLTEPNNRP